MFMTNSGGKRGFSMKQNLSNSIKKVCLGNDRAFSSPGFQLLLEVYNSLYN